MLACREAKFYQLPELAERARASLATAVATTVVTPGGGAGDDTPSDVPANFAEGSAHGGQLMLGRLGSAAAAGGGSGSAGAAAGQQQQGQGVAAAGTALDAIFLETGFVPAAELAGAQASLLESLNTQVGGAPAVLRRAVLRCAVTCCVGPCSPVGGAARALCCAVLWVRGP